MKKNLLMMIAVLAMVFASCNNDEQNENIPAGKPAQLSVKLAGVVKAPSSRAIEAPGKTAAGTIQLMPAGSGLTGQIYVINSTGVVTYHEALNVSQALVDNGPGQILTRDVPSDSRVYIIGNIPAGNTSLSTEVVDGTTTLAQIQAKSDLLTTLIPQTVGGSQLQSYQTVVLANSDGAAKQITLNGNPLDNDRTTVEATVSIELNPLVSRIELGKVTGDKNILGFKVAGVYVDDWYPSFTYGGSFAGTMFSQGQNTLESADATYKANTLGNAGEWAAVSVDPTDLETNPFIATPGAGNVWAYNVAAGSLSRPIVLLKDVSYPADTDGNGTIEDGETYTETRTLYLTVTSYNGIENNVFKRGAIYSIGGLANGIVFGPTNTGLTPNPANVSLQVSVTIKEWEIVYPDANL